jgi:hypothetical protein
MGRKSTVDRYIGKQIGGIVIKEKLDVIDGRLFVNCECLECKNIFKATFHNVYRGNYKSCGCLQYALNYKNPRWKGFEEISQSFIYSIMRGAKDRNMEFSVSIEYLWNLFLKQNRKCAISGVDLRFQKRISDHNATASLDRIDSLKGYLEGNVQWVHKTVNQLKWDLSNDELMTWVNTIYKYNNE